MTVEDCVHGYFLLKGAILGGAKSIEAARSNYNAGMSDAYNSLKDLVLYYERSVQQCNTKED